MVQLCVSDFTLVSNRTLKLIVPCAVEAASQMRQQDRRVIASHSCPVPSVRRTQDSDSSNCFLNALHLHICLLYDISNILFCPSYSNGPIASVHAAWV